MSSQNKTIYSVSRLNYELRQILEDSFPTIWVEGEISNLSTPQSGHSYFSIKDEKAQIRCAFFKNKKISTNFELENGKKFLLKAKVALYEPRGDCQLIVEKIEPIGDGSLQKEFEQLKNKLFKEGLFDAENKKEIPQFPKKIGIISSPTGAAIKDILNVLKRRYPIASITLYATSVQGSSAATEISQALKFALKCNQDDVIIITRGGGSIEDLSAFNDENLAREIHKSPIPIVSAIGHEIDFTIADFVADKRAPTPSSAAEIVSPSSVELLRRFQDLSLRIKNSQVKEIEKYKNLLKQIEGKLNYQHPGSKIKQQQQQLDEMQIRMKKTWNSILSNNHIAFEQFNYRLIANSPIDKINSLKIVISQIKKQMESSIAIAIKQKKSLMNYISRQLNSISPLATLERGFSITSQKDGTIVKKIEQISINEKILIQLSRGSLEASVSKKNK